MKQQGWLRIAVGVGVLSAACTCDDHRKVVNAAPAVRSIADRLGFEPKGLPTALDAYGLSASAVVPAGATLERGPGGAVMTLQGLAVQLRAVPSTERESRLEHWTRSREPRRRESDDDGWLLVADAEGGAARSTVIYRARAGVLCVSAPARDKLVLDEVARVCLSLSPR